MIIERINSEIDFNEIAKYSAWSKRILSLEDFSVKKKTEQEVLREFQDEKWNHLLRAAKKLGKLTIDAVEALTVDPLATSVHMDGGKFYLATNQEVLRKHLDLYHSVLAPHISGASALVELGAGFGSKIFALGEREAFRNIPLVAAEFTENGREVMKLLSQGLAREIRVGSCNFRSLSIDNPLVPENAVIFTSYAAHYVPQLSMEFADFLLRLKPKVIVHFEPVYELCSPDSLYDLMCQRYMELNDYTRNLMSVINSSVSSGRSAISSIQINRLSANPFLPISVVEWRPIQQQHLN